MKSHILILLLVLSSFSTSVSLAAEKENFYSIENVAVNTDNIHPILVVTNRSIEVNEETKAVTLSHEIDTSKINYLIVTNDNGEPKLQFHPNFESAFRVIEHQDLVFHVHGFGQDFNATLRSGITLQKNYDVSLVLFDVPTEQVGFNIFSEYRRTQKYFEQSTHAFDDMLVDYATVANELNLQEKPTLFLHSLGNYLLEEYIESGEFCYNEKLEVFDNILLNAPAVKKKHHSKWVEKIDTNINVFITMNKSDFVLKGAEFLTFSRQLGSSQLKKKEIASNAQYFSFEAIAKNGHNYFIAPEMLTLEDIKIFYGNVLTGNSLPIDSYVDNYSGINIISMNK